MRSATIKIKDAKVGDTYHSNGAIYKIRNISRATDLRGSQTYYLIQSESQKSRVVIIHVFHEDAPLTIKLMED